MMPYFFRALIWDLMRPSWGWAAATLGANLIAAVCEGGTIAFLIVAFHMLSGSSELTIAQISGSWAWLWPGPDMRVSREAAFVALVTLAVLVQLLRSGFQFLGVLATARLQVRVQCRLHNRLFGHLMHLSFPTVSRYPLGELTESLTRVRDLHDLLIHVNMLVSNTLLVAIYLVVLCWISWPMTLAAIPLFWLVSRVLQCVIARLHVLADRYAAMTTAFNRQATEYLQGLRLLHTFARQAQAAQTMEAITRSWVTGRTTMSVVNSTVPMIMDCTTVIGVAAFLVGGYLVLGAAGQGTLVPLLAFLLAVYRMVPRLRTVHVSAAYVAMTAPSLVRVARLLGNTRDDILREPRQRRGESKDRLFTALIRGIEFRDVSLRYRPAEAEALSSVSFVIPRGCFTALVGVTGSGKSSLIDLLLRLYLPTAGEILVDGVGLQTLEVTSWREHLGVVSQEPFLFHATIRENIMFGSLTATMHEVIAAAKAAHAHDFITRLAAGYDTVVEDGGGRLSGGQRQQIALARALIRRPEILILDEATSAVDSESERWIQEALAEQRADKTVIAIAHRLSMVAAADQIMVLDAGRVIEQGTHPQLLAREGLYARLWQLQAGAEEMTHAAAVRIGDD